MNIDPHIEDILNSYGFHSLKGIKYFKMSKEDQKIIDEFLEGYYQDLFDSTYE